MSTDKLQAIKDVQRATEAAMHAVITYITTTQSPTSEEAHNIIDTVLEEFNCVSPEGHIVAGGLQGAEPHEKGNDTLPKGKPIVIDIYPQSKVTGYYADMTRTVCVGTPSDALAKMYDAVLRAQKLAISMVRPGVRGSDIQKDVEAFFTNDGYVTSGKGKEFHFAEGFVHSIGHGVGKKIHIAPHLGRNSNDILREGDIVTIEPGLYYKDKGGIRIEDLLLVTQDGHENLTHFPKTFIQNQTL